MWIKQIDECRFSKIEELYYFGVWQVRKLSQRNINHQDSISMDFGSHRQPPHLLHSPDYLCTPSSIRGIIDYVVVQVAVAVTIAAAGCNGGDGDCKPAS